jgi:TATA-box binding protein (TBP) (component of TFIID and TFIIIB)
MVMPKVCLLIFTSGKVVFTGAKCREDIMGAHKNIEGVLRKHQKKIIVPAGKEMEIRKLRSAFEV